MPIEITEAFGQAPPAAPLKPEGPGLDINKFFESQPKLPTLKDKAAAAAKVAADAAKKAVVPAAKKTVAAATWEGKGLEPEGLEGLELESRSRCRRGITVLNPCRRARARCRASMVLRRRPRPGRSGFSSAQIGKPL